MKEVAFKRLDRGAVSVISAKRNGRRRSPANGSGIAASGRKARR
jgi:hypothetical protein